ncbi:MAG: RidA family protein [Pseudomonadota bacterium]
MRSKRVQLTTGSDLEADFAYSRAVVAGDWCFVSGVTGYDYATMTMPDTAADQAEQCFVTVGAVLADAGFAIADIVRVQYTITETDFLKTLKPVLQRHLGAVRPAATMVVAGLIRPEMQIEIEVTAFRG